MSSMTLGLCPGFAAMAADPCKVAVSLDHLRKDQEPGSGDSCLQKSKI